LANLDRPRGFVCYPGPIRVNAYEAGSACYPGDLVALASDGQVDPAAAGALILGVCLSYASAAGEKILVADDPQQMVSVQADETEIDAQTDIGNNCDIVATAADSTYKTSRQELDSSDVKTGSAQLQILRLEPSIKNAFGANATVICRINEHQFGNAVAGV
jgi:hypothetical protein